MQLFPENYEMMKYLLGKALVEGISSEEENRLRILISVEFSFALKAELQDVISLGTTMVGIRELIEKYR